MQPRVSRFESVITPGGPKAAQLTYQKQERKLRTIDKYFRPHLFGTGVSAPVLQKYPALQVDVILPSMQ